LGDLGVDGQGVWRIRTNRELQNVYRSPDIVTEIKVRRLEWLGHIRMDGARMAKKVFVSKPEGRRNIGRPKLRWLDDVEDDIKSPWYKTMENKNTR
jgi:hypothetical protein